MKIQQYRNPTSTGKWDSLFVIESGNQSIVLTYMEMIAITDKLYNFLYNNNCDSFTNEVLNDKLDNKR